MDKKTLLAASILGAISGLIVVIIASLFLFSDQKISISSASRVAQKISSSVVTVRARYESDQGLIQERVGCGVILREDGYIVTNEHLISGSKDIKVKMGGEDEVTAKVIGSKKDQDIAVIKVEGSGLKEARLGSSSALQVGEDVVAIGKPFRYSSNYTVTKGIVSALSKDIPKGFPILLQTDATINPGNSGGPLCDMSGEVIGINTAYLSSGESVQGIGFAVPADLVKQIFNDILASRNNS